MRQLRVLLYKEWRDQRALVLGAVVVCLVAIAIAKLLHGAHFGPLARTSLVLPGCLGLFVLVLATEAITRDVQSGVERTLLRLPVPRATAWLAKAGFVALAGLGFLLLLVLIELALRTFEVRPALYGLFEMVQPTAWLLVAAIGAACMACAGVLERSLPAAFLGIACIAGVPLGALALPAGHAREWLDVMLCSWTPASLSALACGAFLLASLIAFGIRRPGRFGLRRAAGAALGAVVVLGPAIAGTAWRAASAFDIELGSANAEIAWICPSPDGRFLAVQVQQTWKVRDNWIALTGKQTSNRDRIRFEVWLLDRSTGIWTDIDGRFRALAGSDYAWSDGGQLRTASLDGSFGDGEAIGERIDPATRAVVSAHSGSTPEDLGHWYQRSERGDELVVRWRSRGLELRLPKSMQVRPSTEPGIVFDVQEGVLLRHEMATGCETRLAALDEAPIVPLRVSPDGRRLFVRRSAAVAEVLDACDGRVLRRFDAPAALIEWSRVPGRIGIWCRSGGEYVALEEDGSLTTLPTRSMRCQELGRDRLLAYDTRRIECMKLDGSEREVLYEARP